MADLRKAMRNTSHNGYPITRHTSSGEVRCAALYCTCLHNPLPQSPWGTAAHATDPDSARKCRLWWVWWCATTSWCCYDKRSGGGRPAPWTRLGRSSTGATCRQRASDSCRNSSWQCSR